MKRLLAVAALALLAGCAAKPLKYNISTLQQSDTTVVKDLRPATEKEQKTFSFLVTSDAYGVNRNSDSKTDPTSIRLLQHRVHEKFGSNQPANVVVYHFVSYTNAAASMRNMATAGIGGIAAKAFADSFANMGNNAFGVSTVDRTAFEASEKEEFRRGLFSASENPAKKNLYIIYLDAEINGKRQFIRKTSVAIYNKDGTESYGEALDATIKAFLASY